MKMGRRKIRFSITGNGIRYDDIEEAMKEIKESLVRIFGIPYSSLNIYYYYYRIHSEPFCYLELYLEADLNLWKGKRCMSMLYKQRQQVSQELVRMIHRDIYIEISPTVYSKRDVTFILVVCVFIVILMIAIMTALILHIGKVIQERRENYLLMC